MAQNIINVQYIHMQNPGVQQAPPGQTYQLPPNSLPGEISVKRNNPEAGKRKIKTHKAFIGITDDAAGEALYAHWRETVKDQMLARNYDDIYQFPDAEFQQIVTGMRRLLPVCDALATASAANNIRLLQEIDEGVVQLVKDWGKKLTNTRRKRVRGAPRPGNPGVPPAQVLVRGAILPPGAPAQWGPATAGPNAGLIPQNAPLASNQAQPGPAHPVNNPAQSGPTPQTNVPGTSRRITRSTVKAAHPTNIFGTLAQFAHAPPGNSSMQSGPAHPTNTHSTPAEITSPAGNRPTQSGPADPMSFFRMLAQIAHDALPGNSSAQSGPAHPTSTPSTPSTAPLFGPSPPGNSSTESGSAHPTNAPSTTSTLLLFLPIPPGHSSTESGSAHPTNAPNTVSTPLLFTPSPPRNSPTQSVRGDPTNDPGTSASIVPAPPENRQMSNQIPRGEILLILSPCFRVSLTKKT